jgi:hypothetical protein
MLENMLTEGTKLPPAQGMQMNNIGGLRSGKLP